MTSSSVASKHVSWPVYQADAIGYYQSQLPYPIVIYVYSSQGDLVGIINPHGHSDDDSMRELEHALVDQKFDRLVESKRIALDSSLKNFLLDQGYEVHRMVKGKAKYALLLVMPKVKKTDCAEYIDIENKFKRAIRKSMHQASESDPLYSVAIIEIESPKVKITCQN